MSKFFDFFKYRIIECKTDAEFDGFTKEFAKDMGYMVPASFLKTGKLWAVLNPKKEYVGGYALIQRHPVRSLEEIPNGYLKIEDGVCTEWGYAPPYFDLKKYINDIGEFTCIWCRDKLFGFPLSMHIAWKLLVTKGTKWWAYSYPISEIGLGRYYAKGNPVYLYLGPIVRLEGHPENPENESVEILSNWGVFKIVMYRNVKYLLKFLKGN
jgi:hypothetical protein